MGVTAENFPKFCGVLDKMRVECDELLSDAIVFQIGSICGA